MAKHTPRLEASDMEGDKMKTKFHAMLNLTGTNLTEANLYGADLTEANWNKRTIWPVGFTPPTS